jgi:hypothetical protein
VNVLEISAGVKNKVVLGEEGNVYSVLEDAKG